LLSVFPLRTTPSHVPAPSAAAAHVAVALPLLAAARRRVPAAGLADGAAARRLADADVVAARPAAQIARPDAGNALPCRSGSADAASELFTVTPRLRAAPLADGASRTRGVRDADVAGGRRWVRSTRAAAARTPLCRAPTRDVGVATPSVAAPLRAVASLPAGRGRVVCAMASSGASPRRLGSLGPTRATRGASVAAIGTALTVDPSAARRAAVARAAGRRRSARA
jgi:hypothetical protein